MKEPAPFLFTEALLGRIAARFPPPAWCVLYEVRDGTGFMTRGRKADALAFGTWPSRGLDIIGFEVKRDRGDWLRELKNPEKAEGIAPYCDSWWLVANEGVAKADEIPTRWGWMVPTSKGLNVLKPCVTAKPRAVDKVFLASIVRNFVEKHVRKECVQDRVKELFEEQKAERDRNEKDETERLRQMVAEYERRFAEFKEASGIDLHERWSFPAKETGAIVKALLDASLPAQVRRVQEVAAELEGILKTMNGLPLVQAAARSV